MKQNELVRKIAKQIEKNSQSDTKLNNLIGSEIRMARKNRHLTFKETCLEICCESYLNKLELRGEMPKPKIFSQLCERVGLEQENLTYLDSLLAKTFDALYSEDGGVLEENYQTVKNQTNHRAKLIMIAYYVFNDMLYEASNLEEQIDSVIDTMCNMDIDYYLLLEGIIAYKSQLFKEAISLFKLMVVDVHISELIFLLRDKYMVTSLLCSGDVEFLYRLQEYRENLLKHNVYNEFEFLDYLEAFYLLAVDSRIEYENVFKRLKKSRYINSLLYYDLLLNQKIENVSLVDDGGMNLFTSVLCKIIKKEKGISVFVSKLKPSAITYDFSIITLEYCLLKNDQDRLKYITNLIASKNNELQNIFVYNFFKKEVMRIAYKLSKYKLIYDYMLIK